MQRTVNSGGDRNNKYIRCYILGIFGEHSEKLLQILKPSTKINII